MADLEAVPADVSYLTAIEKSKSESKQPSLTSKDLDSLMAKLEQDNKMLAELDRELLSVSDCSLAEPSNSHQISTSLPSLNTSSHLIHTSQSIGAAFESSSSSFHKSTAHKLAHNGTQQITTGYHSEPFRFTDHVLDSIDVTNKAKLNSLTAKDLDKLMEKLEQDNRVLAELDRKLKYVSAHNLLGPSQSHQLSSSLPSLNTSHAFHSSLITGVESSTALSKPYMSSHMLTNNGTQQTLHHSHQHQSHQSQYQQQLDELRLAEDIVDSIEIPNRGRCKVYIARYNYDPFKQSPNDNPEAEVVLLAGDFVLIFGNMDEDGFFYGELLDGRRGLVPCNFIEKLCGEDLFEFQASVLYGNNRDSESDTASYPPEFYDAVLNDTMCHTNFQHLLAPDDFHRINDYIDLEDITEIDEDISDLERAELETAKNTVSPPQRLILERQLHKSVLIGWLHPECPKGTIESYQIYVDGVLKATISSADRTKALVEGVDSSMPHRISVRAIDRSGRQSKDPGCTIVIGKNIPFAPCCVRASNITSEAAVISWIPCNSNFYHVVAVNSVEVRTVRPSVFKHLITGLAANTLYRVSVRAKPGKLLCSDEKNPKKLEMLTTFVDFRTLPKSLPDPPVDIQVESGPQEGTLLVTWLPVTLNQFGTSNNCPVTGYAVFAGHKKLSEIDSPTGDHALLEISHLEHLHKKAITVRTKSGENLSQDSMPCQIPDDLLKVIPISLHKKTHRSDSESDTELTQLMNSVVRREKAFDPKQAIAYDHRTNKPQTSRPSLRTSGTSRASQQRHHQQSQQLAHQQTHHSARPQGQHILEHDENLSDKDLLSRMNIPAIEITKDTPSESINPIESYSEEEFDVSMRQRTGGAPTRNYSVSPLPPQRTRAISEYERSNFGPSGHTPNRKPPTQQALRDRERGIRWFVALFDYDPLSMSPNPDAAEEELPFQEGQLIKIYGDKDPDGFYRGEANGRVGFVPCNMVSEVQYDSMDDLRGRHANVNDPWAHLPVKKMVALYDYDPQELSPNVDAEMELAFNTGDIVYVYGEMDEDGFFMGEMNGVRGLVPSNFLSDSAPIDARHGKPLGAQLAATVRGERMTAMNDPQGLPQHPPQAPLQYQQAGDPRRMQGLPQGYTMGQQLVGPPGQPQPPYTPHQLQGAHQQQLMYSNQQQYQQQQQPNQAMGRGMRQQGPMPLAQSQYNPILQGVAMPGNKQRPNTLDLHSSANARFSQSNHNNNSQQQAQHTGMLGSLFASGKKILEEATTPLGARGPFAHPNQSHPAAGHHALNSQSYPSYNQQQYGQSGQQYGQSGQQLGQQQGGTILNTMKNIFKL